MERASADPRTDPPAALAPVVRPPDPVQRWRLTVRRGADAPVVAQRDWQAALEAALLASGLPLARGDGPRPRLAVAAPLGQGMAAERELLEIFLLSRLPVWAVREAVSGCLPEGHELVDVEDVWLGEPAVAGRVAAAEYEVPAEGWPGAELGDAMAELLAAGTLPRQRVRGERTVEYDLRPFVEELAIGWRDGRPVIRMRLRHDPEKGVGRPDEVLAELASRMGRAIEPATIVRTGLVLGPPRGGAAAGRPAPSRSPRGPR